MKPHLLMILKYLPWDRTKGFLLCRLDRVVPLPSVLLKSEVRVTCINGLRDRGALLNHATQDSDMIGTTYI